MVGIRPRLACTRAGALVLVLATVLSVLAAPVVADDRQRLDATRERIQDVRRQIERQERAAREDADAIAAADRRLAELIAVVDEVEADVQRQRRAVAAASRRVARYTRQEQERTDVLHARAVAIYQGSGISPMLVVLDADGLTDAIRRVGYANHVVRADRALIDDTAAARVATEHERGRLEQEESRLLATLDEQRQIMAEVDELRQTRTIQLAERRAGISDLRDHEDYLRDDEAQLVAAIRRAEEEAAAAAAAEAARVAAEAAARAQAEAVAAAAAESEATRVASAPAATQPQRSAERPSRALPPPTPIGPPPVSGIVGGWMWPASGRVSSEFGARWGRQHQGIDIAAPVGTPLHAARAGTVTFAGTMGGYGMIVLIDHGQGVVTAYAHMSRFEVAPGDAVATGQRIGDVGNTGSSTGPHVHFEIRIGGVPVNPRTYLP
jgi:septal ring factor EnvC (AmiA/AmiB activator)